MSARVERGAIVLAGGRSTRMGRDKASLPFRGTTLLGRAITTLSTVVDRVVVVARRAQALPASPPLPRAVPVDVAFDRVEDAGPVGGLVAGLEALDAELVYLSSCDVPWLRPTFVDAMFAEAAGVDVALPEVEGRLHPLAGVYRRDAVLPAARAQLAAGRLRPVFLLESLPHRRVVAQRLRSVDPDLRSLENVNTQDDLARALTIDDEAAAPRARVTIELFGIARRRAGRESVQVDADTLEEALLALESAAPALRDEVLRAGRPAPHWCISLDGVRFLTDPATRLLDGARLLLLSSLAGG